MKALLTASAVVTGGATASSRSSKGFTRGEPSGRLRPERAAEHLAGRASATADSRAQENGGPAWNRVEGLAMASADFNALNGGVRDGVGCGGIHCPAKTSRPQAGNALLAGDKEFFTEADRG